MSEKIPQENKSYEEKVLSEEAQETFKKVQEGREKKESQEARIASLNTRIEEIEGKLNDFFKNEEYMTQDAEKGMELLHSNFALIAEGQKLIQELKSAGAPELEVKRKQKRFENLAKDDMARVEDIMESRLLDNAS